MEFGLVNCEAAKAVSVCEFSERAKLRVGERGLQFKFGFEERHTEIIAGPLEVLKREADKRADSGQRTFLWFSG